MEIVLLIAVVVFAVTSFALQKWPIDVTAITVLGLLLLFGLVTPEQGISGFSNPAVITVMMMFVLSGSLVQSGIVSRVGHRIAHLSGGSGRRAAIALLLLAGVVSAFINNTAAVAILMPMAILLAKHYRHSPSRLLIPLSYVSILGGTCTLIGTSTNLLVSSLAVEAGQAPFGVFELAAVGVPLFLAGLAYVVVVPMRWMPERDTDASLTRKYHLSSYLTEVRVPPGSSLVGRTVLDEGLSDRFRLNVLEIVRGERKIAVDIRSTPIAAGDVLIVRGAMEDILACKVHYGLLLLSDIKLGDEDLSDASNILIEIQLSPTSRLVGRTLKDIDFRKRYGCFVLALKRPGGTIRDKLAFVPLQQWDTLLVFGPRLRIEALNQMEDFTPLQEVPVRLRLAPRWWLSAAVIPAVAAAAALGLMPILSASILAVVVLLLTRTLTIRQAYDAIDWTVIFLLATLLPIGIAMQNTGLDVLVGETLAGIARPYGPWALLAAMILATSLFTEIISNNAAAVLMVPPAVAAAASLGIDPKPLLMGITYAASMSFMTPIGYQTNTMVFGPGGYRFTDFTRFGAPMNLIGWLLASLLIPVFWPF